MHKTETKKHDRNKIIINLVGTFNYIQKFTDQNQSFNYLINEAFYIKGGYIHKNV